MLSISKYTLNDAGRNVESTAQYCLCEGSQNKEANSVVKSWNPHPIGGC